MPSTRNQLLAAKMAAGMDYIAAGFPVVLLHHRLLDGHCSCGAVDCNAIAKHVRHREHYEGTLDPHRLGQWLRHAPESNLGMLTGKRSRVFALDIDGPAGLAALAKLERRYATLPFSLRCRTGNGFHIYFQMPKGAPAMRRHLLPGLDVKADPGFIVVPPSVHASGLTYEWVGGFAKERIAPAPRWLLKRSCAGLWPDDWRSKITSRLRGGIYAHLPVWR